MRGGGPGLTVATTGPGGSAPPPLRCLRAPRRDVQPAGTFDGAGGRAGTTWSTLGVGAVELCRWPSSPAGATGATTGSFPSPSRTPTAATGAPAASSTLPTPRPGRRARRRLQPPRARGQRARPLRAVFHRPLRDPVGQGGQLRRAGSDDVRRYFVQNAEQWLRGLPHRRPTARCRARDRRPNATPFLVDLARGGGRPSATTGRRHLIAESADNDPKVIPRSTRAASASTPSGTTTSTTPCTRVTGERYGYYPTSGPSTISGPGMDAEGFVYQGEHSAYRGRATGPPRAPGA